MNVFITVRSRRILMGFVQSLFSYLCLLIALDMELSPLHRTILDFLMHTDKPIFLTGKAGTGKTTFLRYIKNHISKSMAVVAPTSIAALNAGGVTINSFFQIPFGPLIPTTPRTTAAEKISRMSSDKAKLLASLQLLIIDEISMVRADTMDRIDSILKSVKGSSRPFGGVQLLLIGDLYQLPPVYQQDWPLLKVFYDSPYFFSSLIFKSVPLLTFELTEIFRQADPTFVKILNSIRKAEIDTALLDMLNRRYQPERDVKELNEYITLSTHNHSVAQINQLRLESLPGELLVYKARIAGDFPVDAYPAEQSLQLKVGAQVIFIKNDSSGKKQYYNGRAARIIAATSKHIDVKFLDDESELSIEPETWENVKYTLNESEGKVAESNSGSFTQYPIKLAWAITIHKSQGLTFDRAVIDVEAAFAHGQTYVALSRCRSLEGLILKAPVKAENMLTDGRITRFMDEAVGERNLEEVLAGAKRSYAYEVVADLFDFHTIQLEWTLLISMIDHSIANDTRLSSCCHEGSEILQDQLKKIGDKFLTHEFSKWTVAIPLHEQEGLLIRVKQAGLYFMPKIEALLEKVQQLISLPIEDNLDPDFFTVYNQLVSHLKQKHAALQLDLSMTDIAGVVGTVKEVAMKYHPVYQLKKDMGASKAKEVAHPLLLDEILAWRAKASEQRNVPDYLLLSQQLCVTIAAKLPRSLGELAQIKGIGAAKATDLGDGFVKIIRNYLGEQDLFA